MKGGVASYKDQPFRFLPPLSQLSVTNALLFDLLKAQGYPHTIY